MVNIDALIPNLKSVFKNIQIWRRCDNSNVVIFIIKKNDVQNIIFVFISKANLNIFKIRFQIWNQRINIEQGMSNLGEHQLATGHMTYYTDGHQLILLSYI